MAYFRRHRSERYEPAFRQPLPEEDEYDEVDDLDDAQDDEEQAYERRERWQLIANIGNFFGVVVGVVFILLLAAVIISLLNWVYADMTQSFTLLQAWI